MWSFLWGATRRGAWKCRTKMNSNQQSKEGPLSRRKSRDEETTRTSDANDSFQVCPWQTSDCEVLFGVICRFFDKLKGFPTGLPHLARDRPRGWKLNCGSAGRYRQYPDNILITSDVPICHNRESTMGNCLTWCFQKRLESESQIRRSCGRAGLQSLKRLGFRALPRTINNLASCCN